jgi:hydroxymethylpyrimidine pyrophosphatase-like HAD family hydrolase
LKKLIVFDLDGTLAESKSSLDAEMLRLLHDLFGVRKLRDILAISLKEMIFIGDALVAGGNDYPAEQAGVVSVPVQGPNETKRVVETIIACLSDLGQEA